MWSGPLREQPKPCDEPQIRVSLFAQRTSWRRGPDLREQGTFDHRGHKPCLTVRSKIPSVARRADSGTIGKRSFKSPLTFDQS